MTTDHVQVTHVGVPFNDLHRYVDPGRMCSTCSGTGRMLAHIIGTDRHRIYDRCVDCDGTGHCDD